MNSSINEVEIEKFEKIATEWWDKQGKFKPLHLINDLRVGYIHKIILAHFGKIEGIKILDIGCGGGLISEALAKLGANVTGIDASPINIKIASAHALREGLHIIYKPTPLEELAHTEYDVVLNMEVIEHVNNPEEFIVNAANFLKKDGLMFLSTINRNPKSYLLAIIAAEYILGWVPKGTHEFYKFLKPSEIDRYFRKASVHTKEIQGMSYNLFNNQWKLADDISVNYLMYGIK